MCRHWMVFVNWGTIVDWKHRMSSARELGGVYPYQYSSDSVRFLQMKPRDVLWIVSTPRFDEQGKSSIRGRARPPAVMARLRIQRMCCNRTNELGRIEKNKPTVCLESTFPCCDDPAVLPEGVHPASDAWSIVAIGEKDPEKNPTPLQTTYPMLYNFFGVLSQLEFDTKHPERKNLKKYLAFVARGEYLNPAQRKARVAGKVVKDPSPYAALGQYLRTPRKLKFNAAKAMDEFHDRAVSGKRVFFSYKWADVERFAHKHGQTRVDWIQVLNSKLDEAGYNSWLDHHQILADRDIGGLLDEVLSDAVHQSVLFVALLTENYGTKDSYTLEEWNRAKEQSSNSKRKDKLQIIVLDCGGNPERLGLMRNETHSIPYSPTPDDVVLSIRSVINEIKDTHKTT